MVRAVCANAEVEAATAKNTANSNTVAVRPRESGDPEDGKQWLSAVVPAQAGTHTPQRGDVAGPAITETLVVMGPRLRGDDSGWVRAKHT